MSEPVEIQLPSLMVAFGTAALTVGLAYVLPGLERYQPWKPGDPIPVLASLTPKGGPRVEEDERAGLVFLEEAGGEATGEGAEVEAGLPGVSGEPAEGASGEPVAAGEAPGPSGAAAQTPVNPDVTLTGVTTNTGPAENGKSDPASAGAPMEGDGLVDNPAPAATPAAAAPAATTAVPSKYKAGFVTPLEDAGHVGMRSYFQALKRTGEGGVARALHYGDSTIAADGLARTIRGRLQARFGNAGPGFVSAGMDPRWNKRTDVESSRSGSWTTRTILLGGAGGRYGLGGIVGIGSPGAYTVMRAIDAAKTALPMKHLELWYQAGVGYGSLWASVDDREVLRESTAAEATDDRRFSLDVPEGFSKLAFGAEGGPVPLYGVVLESGAPGVTWEALGVIGVGSKSFSFQNKAHLSAQMAQRKPDLIVVMLGGNEAGYPILLSGDGSGYRPFYQGALDSIRAGAPQASCLVISPLDQGTREETDVPRSKPTMKPMVANQRKIAADSGCAFFSAYDAMGGQNSIVKWSSYKSPLAWSDLVHLSGAGLDIIGNLLSDAMLANYDAWLAGGGA